MDAIDPAFLPATELLATASAHAAEFANRLRTSDTASKNDASPVTAADLAIQAIVVLGLRERYGDISVVGEESTAIFRAPGGDALRSTVHALVRLARPAVTSSVIDDAIDMGAGDGFASTQWIIDPIDGTRGYLTGQQYCVCLALAENGVVQFGGAGCPRLGDRGLLVAGARGSGAWAWQGFDRRIASGDQPTRLVARTNPRNPVIASESPEASDRARTRLRHLAAGLAPSFEARPMESQCKFVLVATGQVDLALRLPPREPARTKDMVWDYAGAVVMAEEAGASMTDCRGLPLRFGAGRCIDGNHGILCAAPWAHASAIERIRQFDSDVETSQAPRGG